MGTADYVRKENLFTGTETLKDKVKEVLIDSGAEDLVTEDKQ